MRHFNKGGLFILIFTLICGAFLPLLSHSAFADDTATNLIANSSLETANPSNAALPQSWLQDKWGTNTETFSYDTTGHTGNRSATVNMTKYTSGDAKWYFSPVTATGSTSYTYSDYYKASISSDVVTQFDDGNGNYTYQDLGSAAASTAWSQYTATFTTPANTKNFTIFHLIAGVGTLTLDDASLTAAAATVTTPPVTDGSNLIANNSLETADPNNSAAPQNWLKDEWGTNTETFSYASTGHTGSRAVTVKMTKYTSGDAKWYAAPVNVAASTNYTYSDYYQSSIATEIVAQLDDGTGNYTYVDMGSAAASTAWKEYTGTLATTSNTKSVAIFHLIAGIGSLTIDDASFAAVTTGTGTGTGSGTTNPTPTNNLVPNASVETPTANDPTSPQSWYKGQWGNNATSFSYPTSGHIGNRSVGITMSNFVDGGANWTYDAQAVTPGKVYSFSDYYQSNTLTQVIAAVTLSDGTTSYVWLGNPYTSDGTWTRFFSTFTMPANAVSAVVYQTISSNGYFIADDYNFDQYTPQGFNTAMVSVTFDDGVASQYTNALPVLEKDGLEGTFYIITGELGVCDPAISSICYLTTSQVSAIKNAHQEIGSHTVTHPDLTTISAADVNTELSQSQATLENLLGVPVTNLASPYGDVNQAVLAQSQQYYTSQRGVEAGYNSIDNYDQQNLLVQNVDTDTTTAQVESYIDYAKATNTWLILVYHDISKDTTLDPGYDTTPSAFKTQMAYLKASGVTVKTMQDALSIVTPQL